jgi:drug/metabolite transporter (DMT)-like permease
MIEQVRTAVAGIIIIVFFGTWLAMEWTGREPDTIVLLGAVAIVMGAGYYLWDDAMSEGVDAVQELEGGEGEE